MAKTKNKLRSILATYFVVIPLSFCFGGVYIFSFARHFHIQDVATSGAIAAGVSLLVGLAAVPLYLAPVFGWLSKRDMGNWFAMTVAGLLPGAVYWGVAGAGHTAIAISTLVYGFVTTITFWAFAQGGASRAGTLESTD